MKKIFKQSFSLALALLMVLSLVPAMPLVANAEDFTPGASWTIASGYDKLIQGSFTPAGDDFIYEADEAFNWKTYIKTSQNVTGLQSKAMLTYNGQTVTKTASGINATSGTALQLWTPASFPVITAEMYGNFTLTVEIYYGGNVIATGVLNFVRNAPAPVETEPVETEPVETEPVETEPVETEPVETEPVETEPEQPQEGTLSFEYRYGTTNLIQVNTNLPATTPPVNFTADQNGCGIDQSGNPYQQVGWIGMNNVEGTIVLTFHFGSAFEVGQYYMLPAGSVFGFTDGSTYTLDKTYVFTCIGSDWKVSNPDLEEPEVTELSLQYFTGAEKYIGVATNLPATTPLENFTADQNGCNIDQSGNPYQQVGWIQMVNQGGIIGLVFHFNDAFEAGQYYTLPAGSVFGFTDGNTYTLDNNYTFTWDGSIWTVNVTAPSTEPEAPTKPGEVVWQYGKTGEGESYDWLNGAISTKNSTGIYKGWDAYDWAITLSPTKTGATVTVEAQIQDMSGAVISTATKEVEVGKAPAVTNILTAGDFSLSNKTLGDFRVTAVVKYTATNAETGETTTATIAQVQAVFGRRIGDAGTTAVEYRPTYDWITGKFTAVDEDMTYVGIQHYDWKATIAPTSSAATVDVAVTVVNEKGETVATLNKTAVVCERNKTTNLVTAGEIAELTADLYGKFAVTTVASMGGKDYVGIYGVIEHVEGEFVADTVAPEFAPANWENCGLPTAVTVANNGEMNKQIQVKISITDAQGNVLASMNKTQTVGAGASGALVTTNQLRTFITERGATYYVVIEGKWTNSYDEYTINETLTYVWAEHTDTEVVPGYAATCTAPGLTDGLFCNGCNGTLEKQKEIPVDPEAHNYVDGTCACGATEVLTDSNLKFYSDKGDLMLGDEIKGSFVMSAKNHAYDDYYVEFKMGDVITKVPVSMTSGNYRYFFYTVFAFKMTETVEVTLYGVKDGEAYRGQSVTWTVRDSIIAKLDSWIGSYETDAKKAAACDLLANMLHYGTEAQKELNKENTNYPTDNVDSRYLALIKTTTPEMGTKPADDESGKQATVYRMGMMLQEKIKLYAQFMVSNARDTQNTDYSAVIELTHKDGTTSIYEFTADELSFSGNNTKYVTVQFDKVNCQEMRCNMKFALYLNGEQISATIIRSADMMANDLLGTYPTLIPAIMNYSDCAETYFGM